MFKKIVLLTIFMCFSLCPSFPAIFSYDFSKVISEQDFDGSSIVAISVIDNKNSKTLYSKNENKLLNTASVLKLFTFASALDTLGPDYKFETSFYVYGNSLYLKLGADPLLRKNDLDILVKKLKNSVNFKTIKYIYIDDNIISSTPYPDGWCVDDFWPNIAPFSPYIIDGNKVKILINLSQNKDFINIIQADKYKFSFINELKIADINDISVQKNYASMQNVITLKGSIKEDFLLEIPVSNPKQLFIMRLEEAFGKYSIPYSDKFYFNNTPINAKKIASVFHTMHEVSAPILKNSDNFCAEVLFRVAGAKYAQKHNIHAQNAKQSLGTTSNAILMFYNYFEKLGLDMKHIKIVDGSGVSRYNAASTSWLSEALLLLDKNTDIKQYMEGADEGTLKRRLRYLKGNIWAKTGTHKGLSSLVGIMKTGKENYVTFAIIIQSFSKTTSMLKAFEDDLVDCIFNL